MLSYQNCIQDIQLKYQYKLINDIKPVITWPYSNNLFKSELCNKMDKTEVVMSIKGIMFILTSQNY